MQVDKANIMTILNGDKQFIVPVYQRAYSWNKKQCLRLWNDIVLMQEENRNGHFLGSIVCIDEHTMLTGVNKYLIIDGQQRMTTLMLLLLAFRDYLTEHPDAHTESPESIEGRFIKNIYAKNDEQYKVLLTKVDKDILIKRIERTDYNDSVSSRLLDNYQYFLEKIQSNELSLNRLFEGLQKLELAYIKLDRLVDDPQLIFESLNSTGMSLAQTDLIRNNILMDLKYEDQNRLYEHYWYPMEQLFDYSHKVDAMDKFFRDYLTVQLKRIPTKSAVYEEFQSFFRKKKSAPDFDVSLFCKELSVYAKLYSNMLYAKCDDLELKRRFENIQELQMDVAYPFLLKVYMDYHNDLIVKSDFVDILTLVETYVFRRSICGIPTSSMNKTFKVAVDKIDESAYLQSVQAFFLLQNGYKAFPRDEDFIENFVKKDIYNSRIKGYILRLLETHKNKTPFTMEGRSIEHIMPQNKDLSEEWKNDLGVNWKEVQERYLHTIGNLTVTSYNSELSDKPFLKKLEMDGGFKEGALRLNSFIVKQTTWNQSLIEERAIELGNLAMDIWPAIKLTDAELAPYRTQPTEGTEYGRDTYPYLEDDELLELYEEVEERILELGEDVRRDYKKLYVAFKRKTNFVDIIFQRKCLILSIVISIDEVSFLKENYQDVANKKRWGNGLIEARIRSERDIDAVMVEVEKAYWKQV